MTFVKCKERDVDAVDDCDNGIFRVRLVLTETRWMIMLKRCWLFAMDRVPVRGIFPVSVDNEIKAPARP